MGFEFYLAMEPSEIRNDSPGSPLAWFSCHFSPISGGLCNLPEALPPGSVILLDDAFLWDGQEEDLVIDTLAEAAEAFRAAAVVLDFQRPYTDTLGALASALDQALPCPAVVPPAYEKCTRGPVLLPPIPADVSPERWLSGQRRPVWLEIENRITRLQLTKQGLQRSFPERIPRSGKVFEEPRLCCHYQIQPQASFILYRTKEDLSALLARAKDLGVQAAIGLYQELKPLLA